MLVKVKTLTGNVIELDVRETETIAEFKDKLADKTGIDPSQQKLVYCAKQLINLQDTIGHVGIKGPPPRS